MHSISDFCNRISQACNTRLKKVLVKNSKLVVSSNFFLYKLGYILFFVIKNFKYILVYLKYSVLGSVIRGLISLSKPSLKYYVKSKYINKYAFNNFFGVIGFMILTTNKGKIMLDFDCVSNNVGGKPLWIVY